MSNEYRQEEVNKIVCAFKTVLRDANLNRTEGLNAVVQFLLEIAVHDAAMSDACPRCIAVAMVECLFAQPHLRHRESNLKHLDDPSVVNLPTPKKEGAN